MSITGVLIAALIVGGTGVFIGVFLGIAGKKFAVEVDEKEEAILAELPGNNCGGCGYAGCSGLAAAIAKGEAPVGQCPVGGAPVAAKIAAIMGEEAGESVHEVAFVKCAGTCEKAKQAYDYTGITDCQMAAMMQNGGQGIYPQKMPLYQTAFVFMDDGAEEQEVPPWAMKLVLDEEDLRGVRNR